MSPSDGLLIGRRALITGAGRGIGRACAISFARAGASVLLNARDPDRAAEAAEQIARETGGDVKPCAFDVTDQTAMKAAFAGIGSSGKLDILVNNAGILRDALIGMTTPAMTQEVYAVNVFAPIAASHFASRLMQRQKSGAIVNLASIVGVRGNEGQAVYASSKAAVGGLTLSLAKELAPSGIRVNAVAPGFIETDMTRSVPEAKAEKIRSGIRMGRSGTAEDVANVCLFLASDLAGYVTGQVIEVAGGMTI
jgi:3-oxoacyl-[acyl-carrier protein] reductase